MSPLDPNTLNRYAGPWALDESETESFLAAASPGGPINVIGASMALAERLARRRPDLRVRIICASPHEEAGNEGAGATDVCFARPERFAEFLLPRSRTLLVDALLASTLLSNRDFWTALSLKTFEWVIAPFLVEPEPVFPLFGDEFSFLEPLFDDTTSPWTWSITGGPAVVWIVSRGAAAPSHLSFTLAAAHPGTFEIRLANAVLRHEVSEGNLRAHFRLPCRFAAGANSLRISFDGEPIRPVRCLDQRDALYFCFSGLNAEVAPRRPTGFPKDRAVRRLLHGCGFFEILTAAQPTHALSHLNGLRSCFDYREGFRLRDCGRFTPAAPGIAAHGLAAWYSLRKTPTPHSEWDGASAPCREAPLVVDWSAGAEPAGNQTTDRAAIEETEPHENQTRDTDLNDLRTLLIERTAALEAALRDIALRDADLNDLRTLLVERTAALEAAPRDIALRDADLNDLRTLLVERTAALETALRDAAATQQSNRALISRFTHWRKRR